MIEDLARRYFSQEKLPEVMDILSDYGSESWHREEERVKRDALIISQGSVDVLRATIDLARRDYRDVLISEEVDKRVIEEIRRYSDEKRSG